MTSFLRPALNHLLLVTLLSFVAMSASAAPRKTEAELLKMLGSTDHKQVLDAMDRLPNWYPNSTVAVSEIRKLLGTTLRTPGVPANLVSRKAARALGNYHATLGEDDIKVFLGFIRSSSVDDVMDGLKALRGLKEPREVEEKITAEIVLLLKDKELHVVRDAIRTLGAVGSKETIPVLEPFLKHNRLDVKRDAKEAIASLEKKSAK